MQRPARMAAAGTLASRVRRTATRRTFLPPLRLRISPRCLRDPSPLKTLSDGSGPQLSVEVREGATSRRSRWCSPPRSLSGIGGRGTELACAANQSRTGSWNKDERMRHRTGTIAARKHRIALVGKAMPRASAIAATLLVHLLVLFTLTRPRAPRPLPGDPWAARSDALRIRLIRATLGDTARAAQDPGPDNCSSCPLGPSHQRVVAIDHSERSRRLYGPRANAGRAPTPDPSGSTNGGLYPGRQRTRDWTRALATRATRARNGRRGACARVPHDRPAHAGRRRAGALDRLADRRGRSPLHRSGPMAAPLARATQLAERHRCRHGRCRTPSSLPAAAVAGRTGHQSAVALSGLRVDAGNAERSHEHALSHDVPASIADGAGTSATCVRPQRQHVHATFMVDRGSFSTRRRGVA